MPFTATNLVVTVVPPAIPEGSTGQLSGVASLDDGTVSTLTGGDIGWGTVGYPLACIGVDGLLAATNVYGNTDVFLTASYLGAMAKLRVTVLDSNPDNYGLYSGDGIPDGWQVTHFGTNNPLGVAGATNATGHGGYAMVEYASYHIRQSYIGL